MLVTLRMFLMEAANCLPEVEITLSLSERGTLGLAGLSQLITVLFQTNPLQARSLSDEI